MPRAYHSIVPLEDARIVRAPEPVETFDFLRGSSLGASPPTPWIFDVEIPGDRPPHLLGGRVWMASERLIGALRNAGVDNIETFPARLRLAGGAEWQEHSVLNVIGVVDAADLDASDGLVIAEGAAGPTQIAFTNLVLSAARTRALPAFRLFHDPAMLLVDDRVLRALNRHRPPEGWGFCAVEIEVSDPAASSA